MMLKDVDSRASWGFLLDGRTLVGERPASSHPKVNLYANQVSGYRKIQLLNIQSLVWVKNVFYILEKYFSNQMIQFEIFLSDSEGLGI
jgi:hypothetical protein